MGTSIQQGGGFCKSNKVVKYAAEWAKLNVIQ